MTEPFVALMRRYCIDYTNSHDLSVCDEIMRDDYVVHITGMTMPRDEVYKPAVESVFQRFPNLCLAVHELHTNGERLVMRFSEHAATADGTLACWTGVGLYDWDGERLRSCRVEQDFWSQRRQLDGGQPDSLEPPHLDPWTTTVAQSAVAEHEAVAREWLRRGDLVVARSGRIDDGTLRDHVAPIESPEVDVLDLFSAGDRVAFHARFAGPHSGVLDGVPDGADVELDVAGILRVDEGRVAEVHAVTDRFGAWLRSQSG